MNSMKGTTLNIRALLHAISAGLMAIAVGTVIFVGLPPDVTADVVASAGLGQIVIETYLASTTVGQSALGMFDSRWEADEAEHGRVEPEPDEPRAA